MSVWTPPQCAGPCKRVCISLENATADARTAWRTQQRCPLCAATKQMGGNSVGFRTNSIGTYGIRSAPEEEEGGGEEEDPIVYYRNRPETREHRALVALKKSQPSLYTVIMEQKNLSRRLATCRKFALKNSRMETGATQYDDSKDVAAEAAEEEEEDGAGGGVVLEVPDEAVMEAFAEVAEEAEEVNLLEANEEEEDEEEEKEEDLDEELESVPLANPSVRKNARVCVACGGASGAVGSEKMCSGCRHFILSQI